MAVKNRVDQEKFFIMCVYWLLLKRQKFMTWLWIVQNVWLSPKAARIVTSVSLLHYCGKIVQLRMWKLSLKLWVKGRPLSQAPAPDQLSTIVLVLKLLLDKLSSKSSLVFRKKLISSIKINIYTSLGYCVNFLSSYSLSFVSITLPKSYRGKECKLLR